MTRTHHEILAEFGYHDATAESIAAMDEICEKMADRIRTLEAERDAAVSLATSECEAYDVVAAKLARLSEPSDEPFWMHALRMAAANPLMADVQCVPIVNEGTHRAVVEYIDTLVARVVALASAPEGA